MKQRAIVAGIYSVVIVSSATAAAAPLPVLPGSVDAGRILQENKPVPQPKQPSAPVIKPLQTLKPAPKGAENVTFQLKGVIITGATAYSAADLESIYKRYIGQTIPLSQVYQFVGAITKRYQQDGYTLSRASLPPQEINDGIIKIRVIEGYIDNVDVKGQRHKSAMVDAIINKIKASRPLKIADLERAILILNDIGGISVNAVLAAPEEDTSFSAGATNLILTFADLPVSSSVTADNYGSRYVGPYQLGFQTAATTLPYQQTTLNGLIAVPLKELQYMQASHRLLLNSYGTSGTLQIGYAHSKPGYVLTPNKIESTSSNFGFYVMHPIIRSRAENLYLGGDFSLSNSTTDALGSTISQDRLRVLSIFSNYDNSDALGGSNIAQLRLSQGLDILDATETGSLNLSRALGHSDFTKLSFNAGRLQTITDTVRLYAAATGQYSGVRLLSSEQFGFGGQRFGRAYDASELTGDNGLAGVLELRYSGIQPLKGFNSEFFCFYDIGRVWSAGGGDDISAASAGLGIRFNNEKFSGTLTLAEPLTKKISAPNYGSGYGPRAYFSLTAKF